LEDHLKGDEKEGENNIKMLLVKEVPENYIQSQAAAVPNLSVLF
jgi:hypothetical protein